MNFRIFVRTIILNKQSQVLMLQKSPTQKIAPNLWILPGGAVEFGESADQAALRELKEETGMIAQTLKLIGEDMRIIGTTQWQGLLFLVNGDHSIISNREPNKHAAIQWCDYDFARTVLSRNELIALNKALREQKCSQP